MRSDMNRLQKIVLTFRDDFEATITRDVNGIYAADWKPNGENVGMTQEEFIKYILYEITSMDKIENNNGVYKT